MITKNIAVLCILWCLAATSCIHQYPDEKGEPTVPPFRLTWASGQSDELKEIRLWIFDQNGILLSEQRIESLPANRQTELNLPDGAHSLVAATAPAAHYSCTPVPGTTRADQLLLTVNQPGSNPTHIQHGTTALATGATHATIDMTRSLAELQFTLENLPPEIVSVRAQVVNTAHGFHPATATPSATPAATPLGTQTPNAEGIAAFPLTRLLPTVGQVATNIHLALIAADATEIPFDIQATAFESNKTYQVKGTFDIEKQEITVTTIINEWTSGNDGGEDGEAN